MSKSTEKESRFKKLLPIILSGFMVMQPILDIITASEVDAGATLSIGIVVRTLFLAFCFIYVVFIGKYEKKKAVLSYILLLMVFMLCFVFHIYTKGGISLVLRNIKDLVKVMFVPFTALFLYAIYSEYGFSFSHGSISLTCGIYAAVILVAYLTNTSNISYRSGYGFNGWFYAANEISSIISISAPVMIWYCLTTLHDASKKSVLKVILAIIGLASVVFAATYLGTKIIFLIILTYCAAAVVWCIVFLIKKKSLRSVLITTVAIGLVVSLLAMYPKSPLNGYISNVYSKFIEIQSDDIMVDKEQMYKDSPTVKAELKALDTATEGTWLRTLIARNAFIQRLDSILSRRLFTAAPTVQEYIDGGIMTKLFGTGYANAPNGKYNIWYMIEMDGLGIFIRLGIVGFLLCFIPYFIIICYAIIQFFRHPIKRLSSLRFCSYLFASLEAFAIAFVTGHVLVCPGVGIFMLAVTSNLLEEYDRINKAEQREKSAAIHL